MLYICTVFYLKVLVKGIDLLYLDNKTACKVFSKTEDCLYYGSLLKLRTL